MPWALLALAAVVGLSLYRLREAHRAWRTYRGTRVVSCPRGSASAAVEIDRTLAALTTALGRPWVRLRGCTRWPAPCRRECVPAIRAAPADSLVRNVVNRWSAGRACALCGYALEEPRSGGFGPALLGPEGTTVDWQDLAPDRLLDRLRTDRPVCWYCHIGAQLRHDRPDLFRETGPRA